MTNCRRYQILILIACVFFFGALAFCLFPKNFIADAAEGDAATVDGVRYETLEDALENWTEGKTLVFLRDQTVREPLIVTENQILDLNGFTLRCTIGRTLYVEKGGILTLRGAGTISGGGVYVENGGSFLMNGGKLTDNAAENGGGVYVESGGSFVMNGGSIEGNKATSRNGGGVYVDGSFTVGGSARIFDNTDRNGNANNVYLANDKTIALGGGFMGEVGVTLSTGTGVIVSNGAGNASGFISDNLDYTVIEENGKLLLTIAPLKSIEATYTPSQKIFPTSELEAFKKDISVKGTNINGIAYAGEISVELSILETVETADGEVELEGDRLKVGENTILVTATGWGGETATMRITVEAVAPSLLSIGLSYRQSGVIYFDSDVSLLYDIMNFSVSGNYEDGKTRAILHTSDETAAACAEDYIRDYYVAESELASHTNGTALGRVCVLSEDGRALEEQEFQVNISRHIIDVSNLRIVEVSILEKSGKQLDANAFTPDLPSGITPTLTINGVKFEAGNLAAGIYTVGIELTIADEANYELKGATLRARLLVYERYRSGTSEGISYEVTRSGGISPEWQFSIRDMTKEAKPQLADELEAVQTLELTFLPGENSVDPGEFTVKILLSEKLRGKEELRLFRLRADGVAEEVSVERDGDYLIFKTSNMLGTQFVIAANSHMTLYVTLAICFGAFCFIGAGLMLWYFFYKRKLSLRE